MTTAGIVALVVFGIIILLGVVGGIIAFVIIERNRKKKKEEAETGTGNNGSNGSSIPKEFSIRSVAFPTLKLTIQQGTTQAPNVIVSDDSKILCSDYKWSTGSVESGSGFNIPNGLLFEGKLPTVFGDSQGFLIHTLDTNQTIVNNTAGKSPLDLVNWEYDTKNKTWCNTKNKTLCLFYDNILNIISLEPLDPKNPNYKWYLINPLTTGCKS